MRTSVESTNLLPKDGCVLYFPHFLNKKIIKKAYEEILETTPWREEEIMIFGKKVMQPRLFSWHADPGITYKYSGLQLTPEAWTPLLLELKESVERPSAETFNSVLINLYRDQRDSNGWHSDDEKELGRQPTIASLSFGEGRDFHLKHKKEDLGTVKIHLESGSLLIMKGATQQYWKHSIPKRSRPLQPRINLTFRNIIY